MAHLTRMTMGDLANLIELVQEEGEKIGISDLEDKGDVRIYGRKEANEFLIAYKSGGKSVVSGSVGRTRDQFLSLIDERLNLEGLGLCNGIYVPARFCGFFDQYLEGRMYKFNL